MIKELESAIKNTEEKSVIELLKEYGITRKSTANKVCKQFYKLCTGLDGNYSISMKYCKSAMDSFKSYVDIKYNKIK